MVLLPLQIVKQALDKAGLTGTPYLPADFQPKVLVQIDFPSSDSTVSLGNQLEPSQGKDEPVVSFVAEDPTDSGSTYALLSFDPDAPSREDQKFGPWRHFVLGGLKPKSLEEISSAVETSGERGLGGQGLVEKTQEPLSPWVAPSPGQGTGPHRYCFALYKETKPLLPMEQQPTLKDNERPARRNFAVAEFAKQNGLELVGFNYFLCENP